MNLAYQIERHLSFAVKQWPQTPREEHRRRIRANLLSGQAWTWPEPLQLDLFREAH